MDREILLQMYRHLLAELGPSHWWPGDSPLEISLGAILTQNTNWQNVQKAIDNLKKNDLLQAELLFSLPDEELAALIKPAGYFRIKANRLKNFLCFLKDEVAFDLEQLKEQPLENIRPKLLSVKGIGQETADSILLYALEKPAFVVDSYTARIMNRHMLVPQDISYAELQDFFTDSLPQDIKIYNEYHALLVRVGKNWCKKKEPLCIQCPLQCFLD